MELLSNEFMAPFSYYWVAPNTKQEVICRWQDVEVQRGGNVLDTRWPAKGADVPNMVNKRWNKWQNEYA